MNTNYLTLSIEDYINDLRDSGITYTFQMLVHELMNEFDLSRFEAEQALNEYYGK